MRIIDATQDQDRTLVEALHEVAGRTSGRLATLLQEAAAALDDYRAGLRLATPHPSTGYRLLPSSTVGLLIDIPAVAAACPHCGRTALVDIPEPAPSLPYWTVCAGEHGCGAGYQIAALSVGAIYEPGAQEPTLSVRTETRA